MSARCFAVIPAAGVGSRAGAELPKQYVLLNGLPMLAHAVRAFVECPAIAATSVVLAPGDHWSESTALADLRERAGGRLCFDRVGGQSRAESVINGLNLLAMDRGADDHDWVLVHDAARPCITSAMIAGLIEELADDPVGGLLALAVADTVKRAGIDGRVLETVPRERLWLAQTPQMFRLGMLREAYRLSPGVTDEACAIEAMGFAPRLVSGSPRNFKVTYPADFPMAERYISDSN